MRAILATDPGQVRCSMLARALDEPLAGTAPFAPRWIGLEHPRAWPVDLASHPDPAVRALEQRAVMAGWRLLLIRPSGRRPSPEGSEASGRRVYLADTTPPEPRTAVLSVASPSELAEVPLPAPDAALPDAGLVDPILLVCTHGRRDRCCALDGRALALALAGLGPPAVGRATVRQPAERGRNVDQQEVREPEGGQQNAHETEGGQQDAHEPELRRSGMCRPETRQWEGCQPESACRSTRQPEVRRAESAVTGTRQPEVGQSEHAVTEIRQWEMREPERAVPEVGRSEVWECSHLGGHRFAPTALVLPTGYLYGWLDPATAVAALEAAGRGEVEAALCRGRSAWAPAGQVAELAVRRAFGLRDAAALSVESLPTGDVLVTARDGRRWAVEVRPEESPPERPVSCGAAPGPIVALRAVGVREFA